MLLKRIHKFTMARRRTLTAIGDFFHQVRYRTGEYALRGLIGLLGWIPYRLLVLSTSFWTWVSFGLLWQYRRRMDENVATALGDQIVSPSESKALIWKEWTSVAGG